MAFLLDNEFVVCCRFSHVLGILTTHSLLKGWKDVDRWRCLRQHWLSDPDSTDLTGHFIVNVWNFSELTNANRIWKTSRLWYCHAFVLLYSHHSGMIFWPLAFDDRGLRIFFSKILCREKIICAAFAIQKMMQILDPSKSRRQSRE